jgi:phosphohistidine phosphatase SixA
MRDVFVFVRHGHYDKEGVSVPERVTAPLTSKGMDAAIEAGEWLARRGIQPDLVMATRTRRTQDTAELVAEALGTKTTVMSVPRGFQSAEGLEKLLDEWAPPMLYKSTGRTVVFVGHHTQQDTCQRELEGEPELPRKARGSVLVYERRGAKWVLSGYHVGLE